jgi:erythronate-4-phosphate dehydrogenase
MKIVADENIPFVVECFSSIGEVVVVPGREMTPDLVTDADVLLVRSITPVGENLLKESAVRFVGTATIGFDHIDIEYLSQKNIGFASAPGSNANSAAEYVIAGLLEIGHRLGISIEGKSIGIIGVGNVGGRVATKAEALGMKVYRNDPPLQRQTGNASYLPIEELFDCDFITLHTPLTSEGLDKTFHLVDEGFFKSLKDGCIFFNAARGGVVDGTALKETIQASRLKAVVLDVWEDEPNIDTELLKMVDIGTPHIAGYSLDGKIAGMIMIYKAACEYFGLNAKYDSRDFLPQAAVPKLEIVPGSGSEQEVLLGVVRKIYDIGVDDRKLRRMLEETPEKTGVYFDALRKNYGVRREFQNTKISVATDDAEATENKLRGKNLLCKLAGIGFKVKDGKS